MTENPNIPEGYVLWQDLRRKVDASYTPEQRQEYEEADACAGAQIMLVELVYQMCAGAGISQAELGMRSRRYRFRWCG
jgi:hypothetical protein